MGKILFLLTSLFTLSLFVVLSLGNVMEIFNHPEQHRNLREDTESYRNMEKMNSYDSDEKAMDDLYTSLDDYRQSYNFEKPDFQKRLVDALNRVKYIESDVKNQRQTYMKLHGAEKENEINTNNVKRIGKRPDRNLDHYRNIRKFSSYNYWPPKRENVISNIRNNNQHFRKRNVEYNIRNDQNDRQIDSRNKYLPTIVKNDGKIKRRHSHKDSKQYATKQHTALQETDDTGNTNRESTATEVDEVEANNEFDVNDKEIEINDETKDRQLLKTDNDMADEDTPVNYVREQTTKNDSKRIVKDSAGVLNADNYKSSVKHDLSEKQRKRNVKERKMESKSGNINLNNNECNSNVESSISDNNNSSNATIDHNHNNSTSTNSGNLLINCSYNNTNSANSNCVNKSNVNIEGLTKTAIEGKPVGITVNPMAPMEQALANMKLTDNVTSSSTQGMAQGDLRAEAERGTVTEGFPVTTDTYEQNITTTDNMLTKNYVADELKIASEINDFVRNLLVHASKTGNMRQELGLCKTYDKEYMPVKSSHFVENEIMKGMMSCLNKILVDTVKPQPCGEMPAELGHFLDWLLLNGVSARDEFKQYMSSGTNRRKLFLFSKNDNVTDDEFSQTGNKKGFDISPKVQRNASEKPSLYKNIKNTILGGILPYMKYGNENSIYNRPYPVEPYVSNHLISNRDLKFPPYDAENKENAFYNKLDSPLLDSESQKIYPYENDNSPDWSKNNRYLEETNPYESNMNIKPKLDYLRCDTNNPKSLYNAGVQDLAGDNEAPQFDTSLLENVDDIDV